MRLDEELDVYGWEFMYGDPDKFDKAFIAAQEEIKAEDVLAIETQIDKYGYVEESYLKKEGWILLEWARANGCLVKPDDTNIRVYKIRDLLDLAKYVCKEDK